MKAALLILLAGLAITASACGSQEMGCVTFHDAGGADDSGRPIELCGNDAEPSCENAKDLLQRPAWFGAPRRVWFFDDAYAEQVSDCLAAGWTE